MCTGKTMQGRRKLGAHARSMWLTNVPNHDEEEQHALLIIFHHAYTFHTSIEISYS